MSFNCTGKASNPQQFAAQGGETIEEEWPGVSFRTLPFLIAAATKQGPGDSFLSAFFLGGECNVDDSVDEDDDNDNNNDDRFKQYLVKSGSLITVKTVEERFLIPTSRQK